MTVTRTGGGGGGDRGCRRLAWTIFILSARQISMETWSDWPSSLSTSRPWFQRSSGSGRAAEGARSGGWSGLDGVGVRSARQQLLLPSSSSSSSSPGATAWL